MSNSTAITDRRVSRTTLGFILSLIIHALIASGLYFFFTAQTPAPEPTTPHLALSLAIFQPATPPPPTPDNTQALAAAQQLATQQALARKQHEQQRRDAERRKQARLQREREKQRQEQARIEKQRLEQQRLEKQRLEQQRLEKQRREQQQRQQQAQQQARELAAKAQAERETAQRAEQARIAQAQANANKTDKAANTRTQAFYRYKIEPKYPRKARQRGLEGTTIIQVAINTQGRVTKATIYQPSGHRLLDKAALKAVKQYRFEPHRVNGVAVAGSAEVPVRFELK